MNTFFGEVWTRKEIETLLHRNSRAVERAVLAIYQYQTQYEQATHQTQLRNGVGFSASDAPSLTKLAKRIEAGSSLSNVEVAIARQTILKYTEQLRRIANERSFAKTS